jgi:two-component sensor histidine kinase
LSAILNDAVRVWPQGRRVVRTERSDGQVELAFQTRALQLGFWAGWFSIIAVLADLALAPSSRHRGLVFALTGLAAAGNAAAMLIPWREWLQVRRGRLLLDLWSGGLIAFVAVLVFVGGANYTLLLFLAVPFIAVVQRRWRRGFWLATSLATCSLAAALVPLPIGATAMRLALIAAAVGAALVLARAIRCEASAHKRATARAERERLLAAEANHRIKNNLQTVSDLLLLGRPEDSDGRAFDDAAARIRSIATVHRLLTETKDAVDAGVLLRNLAEGAPVPVAVETESFGLDPSTAQKLGIVANELITNAFQHGAPPIVVRLSDGGQTRLQVDDSGTGVSESSAGLGLRLVRRMVEQGLAGSFELAARAGGGTRAEVVFPVQPR